MQQDQKRSRIVSFSTAPYRTLVLFKLFKISVQKRSFAYCKEEMNGMKKLLLCCACFIWAIIQAGHAQVPANADLMQDSLVKLGHVMYNEPNEPERLQANYTFIKTLVALLKRPNSFENPLEELDMISIKRAPDGQFRVFTWHIQHNDGSYRYYGAIQRYTKDGALSLLPLVDRTYTIANPQQAILNPDNWYGAQYYDIIPMQESPSTYILLGWKGENPKVTQKVIDILNLKPNDVTFGSPVYKGADIPSNTARLIYYYNKQASMLMKYDAPTKRILMDHLASNMKDPSGAPHESYGPDMSYDAWKISGNQLILEEDIPLNNVPDAKDQLYNDPKNPARSTVKKLLEYE